MNYLRNEIVQRAGAAIVTATLLLSVAIPLARGGTDITDRMAANLLGRSLDLPVDGTFLSSWDDAVESDASTLSDFVDAFVRSYERGAGLSSGSFELSTHTLWTILKGISLNVDGRMAATLMASAWKSTMNAAASGAIVSTIRASSSNAYVQVQAATANGHSIVLRSILVSLNPQGP